MKIFFATLILICFVFNSYSQVLEELPFGIIIGQTDQEQIENLGVCEKKSKVNENYDLCEVYDIQGKFKVFMSESQVVAKIYFSRYNRHTLPNSWTNLGLSLGKGVMGRRGLITKSRGTMIFNVIKILKSQHITKFQTSPYSDGVDLIFNLGLNEYQFRVSRRDGLYFINVTEAN